MAGEIMDAFKIVFNSEGLQQLSQELKQNEKELDKYKKEQENNKNALKKVTAEYKKNYIQLQELKKATAGNEEEAKKHEKTINKLNSALVEGKAKIKAAAAALKTTNGHVKLFDNSLKKLKNSSDYSLLKLQDNLVGVAKKLTAIAGFAVLVKKSLNLYEEAEQLGNLADQAGVAVEALQTLSKASGGDYESAASSITNIKENKESYQKAGIKIVDDDSTATFENVAKKMQGLKSEAEKLDLAASLGIDDNTARMLVKGVDSYRESLKKAEKYKLYTKEDIQRMRDYRQIQQDIRMSQQGIQLIVAKQLLPVLTAVAKVTRQVFDFFQKHEGLVRLGVIILAAVSAFFALQTAIKFTGKAFMVLKALITTSMGWAMLAIAALILVIEDLYVFMKGGDSLFGRLWKSWGYDLDMIRQGIKQWCDDLKAMWNNLLAVFDKTREHMETSGEKAKKSILKGVSDEQQEELNKNSEQARKAREKAKKKYANDAKKREAALKKIDEKEQAISRTIVFGGASIAPKSSIANGQKQIRQANNNPMNSTPKGAQSNFYNSQSQNATNTKNSKTVNNKNTRVNANITVNVPSGDPHKVGAATKQAVQSLDNGQRV